MDVKICTSCKEEYPAKLEFFYKQKNGLFGLNSKCKKCEKSNQKQYRSTLDFKEKHRLYMKNWRDKNPEKEKEIRANFYSKNAERLNSVRRDKYNTDPSYKEKKREAEKKYKASGRRKLMNQKPEQMEKARIRSKERRKNEELKKHDYERNKEWRLKNKDHLDNLHKSTREQLKPSYIAQSMRVSVKDLDPEIYETKKIIIKLKRELKSNNIKIR